MIKTGFPEQNSALMESFCCEIPCLLHIDEGQKLNIVERIFLMKFKSLMFELDSFLVYNE